MAVEITGVQELLDGLENRLGEKQMLHITDEALKNGAKMFVAELKRQLQSVRGGDFSFGYTIDEIQISEPMWDLGVRTIKIYWSGPHNRKYIIHLNEYGYHQKDGVFHKPPMFGRIAASLKASEKTYKNEVRKALEGGL